MKVKKSMVTIAFLMLFLATFCNVNCWLQLRRRSQPPTPCFPIDCRLSQWSSWTECSKSCDGQHNRNRHVVLSETCGGTCDFYKTERKSCNTNCTSGHDSKSNSNTSLLNNEITVGGVGGTAGVVVIVILLLYYCWKTNCPTACDIIDAFLT